MIFVKYLLLLSLIVVIFLLITLVTITRPDNQESFTMNLDASFPFELHELLELPDAGPTELKLETIEKEFRFSQTTLYPRRFLIPTRCIWFASLKNNSGTLLG